MNTDTPEHGTRGASALPELPDARIDAMEDAVFARIADERTAARGRSARRGRIWMTGAAAAAVVAVSAIIAPTVLAGLGTDESSVSVDAGMSEMAPGTEIGLSEEAMTDASGGAADSSLSSLDGTGRDIIASSSATVLVEDIRTAAEQVAATAESRGGYVESMSLGAGYSGIPVDGTETTAAVTDGWISVRVPAEELAQAIAELEKIGDVTASSIDRYYVTDQVIDLQARVHAAQASVDRLLELMSGAESVSDLIAAESALAERQATLESYQQQLESLEDQVAMSSLSVSLTVRHEAVEADPAGFWDGLVAGWNGLIATLNGVVVAFGFLIPWLAVVAVVGGIVWAVIALARGRRRGHPES